MSPRRTDGAKKPGRLRGAENRSRALALRIAAAGPPIRRAAPWWFFGAGAVLVVAIAGWALLPGARRT